jgi:hypothetical protein
MPKIYRSMRKEDDDKPKVDATGKGLGVRVEPVNRVTDVDLDREGRVVLNGKGMSVAPGWRDLPYFLIPQRLREKMPAARGSSRLHCFVMGHGAFQNAKITEELELRVDSAKHGVVVPRALVSVDRFQADLAATRDEWSIDEA